MTSYRVKAPLLLLRFRDQASGKEQISERYAGAIAIDPVDDKALQKALDRGWVEEVDDVPAEPAAAPASPPDPDSGQGGEGDGAPAGPTVPKPGQNDPKAAWVDYAVALGADRAEAEAMTKTDLVDIYK